MQNSQEEIRIVLANEHDSEELVAFLRSPEIDRSFVPPLTAREISIEARVHTKLQSGFWLIAREDDVIAGCRGCNGLIEKKKRIVEFSTLAIHPAYRRRDLGTRLVIESVDLAVVRYAPDIMKFDSWVTNTFVEEVARNLGFAKHRIYDDPKRPPGIKSVEYRWERDK